MTWDATKDGRKVADYIAWGLSNQETFKTKGVNLTETQLVSKICNMAANKFGWTEAYCLTNFNKYSVEMGMRTSFKYAAYNSVWACPTVFVNGVQAPPEEFPRSISEWNYLLRTQL